MERKNKDTPLVLHVPHSSTYIPERYRSIYIRPDEVDAEALEAADLYADELFRYPAATVVFPVSRLLCDVERFRDPVQEGMTGRGMWVCYTRDMQGRRLAQFEMNHVAHILQQYYDVHHAHLTAAVEKKLLLYGKVLVTDCHTFPDFLPYYKHEGSPDICLGTDAYHTPSALVRRCRLIFEQQGYSVSINDPFAGALVPMRYYGRNRAVQAIMVEINRRLYCDAEGRKTAGYERLKRGVQEVLQYMETWISDAKA